MNINFPEHEILYVGDNHHFPCSLCGAKKYTVMLLHIKCGPHMIFLFHVNQMKWLPVGSATQVSH